MIKDSDLGRPSSEHLSRLGALARRGSGCLSLRASEGKPGRDRRRRAPGRPAAQTKLRPESCVFPVRLGTGHNSDTTTPTCDRPVGAGHPPLQPPTRRHTRTALGRSGARARARVPARRCPHALVAPAGSSPARASPLPAGPSGRGKQRSRRRSARRARLRQPHCVPLPSRRTRLALTPRGVRAPAALGP